MITNIRGPASTIPFVPFVLFCPTRWRERSRTEGNEGREEERSGGSRYEVTSIVQSNRRVAGLDPHYSRTVKVRNTKLEVLRWWNAPLNTHEIGI